MSVRQIVGVVLVVLSVGVPVDMFACGDKFLRGGSYVGFQRGSNARAAYVLIYAAPASVIAATIKEEKIESRLKSEFHRITKVQTLQELSTAMSSGRFDVILTANGDKANVQKLLQPRDATFVLGVEDLLKRHLLLDAIDKAVVQRDQNLKPVKR